MDEGGRKVICRRSFLAGLASASLGTALLRKPAIAERRPNVVVFLVDDLGWMDCSLYGSRYYETPNVDRLPSQSVRFTDACSAGPLCTATRASIMTGKHPGCLHSTGASGHVPARPGPLGPEDSPPHQEILSPRCQGFLPLEEYMLARKSGTSLAYPYVFERVPGEIWLTAMQGGARVQFREAGFFKKISPLQKQ